MAPFLKDSAVVGMLIHQCQKPVPVFVREKYRLPVIATLRDVQRVVGGARIWVCEAFTI